MRYKGIIFDLDGVICSTDEYHYLAWKALADRLGIPFDRERNNLLRGVSRMASLEDAHAGVEAAIVGGFDCAAIGDAKDDIRAKWHLEKFSDFLHIR